MDLDHLTVTGDVYFGRNVTLRGTVISNAGLVSSMWNLLTRVQLPPARVNVLMSLPSVSWRTVSSLHRPLMQQTDDKPSVTGLISGNLKLVVRMMLNIRIPTVC